MRTAEIKSHGHGRSRETVTGRYLRPCNSVVWMHTSRVRTLSTFFKNEDPPCQISIGIDVGKMSLDCAWLRDLDQDKPKRKKVENSPQGFKSMLTWAQDVSGLAASELSFMVEPTGIYHEFLVQFLYQHQATIYLVNGVHGPEVRRGHGHFKQE